MDFNLPDLPPNNYTQNLSNPLPTQISLDQLVENMYPKIIPPEVKFDDFLSDIGFNEAILPEKVKIKREEGEENESGDE
jgi:hypothetical protein